MCGIVGIIGSKPVSGGLVEALRRLEYRGYDSAGVATLSAGKLARRRSEGKLVNLERRLDAEPLPGHVGIGHTRWATHGRPTERNAHPHMTRRVSVVHNGIIENYRELKIELETRGHVFETETDTEAVAHLLTEEMDNGATPLAAVRQSLKRLKGAFALGIIFAEHDDVLFAARQGSPLAIGYGTDEMYLGSDAIALAPFTDRLTYLNEGDWAMITRAGARIFDGSDSEVERGHVVTVASSLLVDKGNYRHFMAKEIHEQPEVVRHTIANYVDLASGEIKPFDLALDLSSVDRVLISACGTAYYAGLVSKYWFERYAGIPVEIDVASEMRYREPPLTPGGLSIFVSQSGETADTLATLRYCKAGGQRIAAVVNVTTSTIAREADIVLPTLAGPEIGVASTKAFTSPLAVLACLAIAIGKARGRISPEMERELAAALGAAPGQIASVLRSEKEIETIARRLASADDVLYLGRGISYPLALEGALKLKEVSYVHAEGYAAGELKHGPIALIDDSVPVVVIAPHAELFDKTASNIQEVAARGGAIILISDAEHESAGCALAAHIPMPQCHPFTIPLLYAIPLQLLAYHAAVHLGSDVDQPRNLAKSVTVE